MFVLRFVPRSFQFVLSVFDGFNWGSDIDSLIEVISCSGKLSFRSCAKFFRCVYFSHIQFPGARIFPLRTKLSVVGSVRMFHTDHNINDPQVPTQTQVNRFNMFEHLNGIHKVM